MSTTGAVEAVDENIMMLNKGSVRRARTERGTLSLNIAPKPKIAPQKNGAIFLDSLFISSTSSFQTHRLKDVV